jgi:hypothetical protein
MTPRFAFAMLVLLSQTGCVAALPMATQLMSGGGSSAQLCSMAKLPGQSTSLCDHFATDKQTPADATTATTTHNPNGAVVAAAAR